MRDAVLPPRPPLHPQHQRHKNDVPNQSVIVQGVPQTRFRLGGIESLHLGSPDQRILNLIELLDLLMKLGYLFPSLPQGGIQLGGKSGFGLGLPLQVIAFLDPFQQGRKSLPLLPLFGFGNVFLGTVVFAVPEHIIRNGLIHKKMIVQLAPVFKD